MFMLHGIYQVRLTKMQKKKTIQIEYELFDGFPEMSMADDIIINTTILLLLKSVK